MVMMSKEHAEELVTSGEFRYLSEDEQKQLLKLCLDMDGDVEPLSGKIVYMNVFDTKEKRPSGYGIISCQAYGPVHYSPLAVQAVKDKTFQSLFKFDTRIYSADEEATDSDGATHYYRNGKEYKVMSKALAQLKMGEVSHLIANMTLRGATKEELAKAAKHSMVIVDAVKLHLDYKQSEADNDIEALLDKYFPITERKAEKAPTGRLK